MTKEMEKRFLLLLSSLSCGTNASKANVLDRIDDNGWIRLTTEDLKLRTNRNEPIWRNDLAFIRKHLAIEGLFQSQIKNDWSITELGKVHLSILYKEAKSEVCQLITEAAIKDANEIIKDK